VVENTRPPPPPRSRRRVHGDLFTAFHSLVNPNPSAGGLGLTPRVHSSAFTAKRSQHPWPFRRARPYLRDVRQKGAFQLDHISADMVQLGIRPFCLTSKQESSPERLLGVDHPNCPQRTHSREHPPWVELMICCQTEERIPN